MTWKVHEVDRNLHAIDVALPWIHLTKEVFAIETLGNFETFKGIRMFGGALSSHWFGKFMKLLEKKVHRHEIEVCDMSSRFRRFTNLVKKLRLHELEGSWNSSEPACNWLCTSMKSSYQKSIYYRNSLRFWNVQKYPHVRRCTLLPMGSQKPTRRRLKLFYTRKD
jgi:hypothetical protein